MEAENQPTCEDLILHAILCSPAACEYYLTRVNPETLQNTYNQVIFYAVRDMDKPINAWTVFRELIHKRELLQGIASHLAWINSIGWAAEEWI